MDWLKSFRRECRWAVGVVISPEADKSFAATVDALLRAGWENPYLFVDGTISVPERFAHLPGVVREPPVGPWPHYYLALAELTMRHPDADAYLLAQEDASFGEATGLRAILEQQRWPSGALTAVANSNGLAALVYPRRLAQDFLLDEVVCAQGWKGRQDPQGMIQEWIQCRRIPICDATRRKR